MPESDHHFIRLPTPLLESLLVLPLTGTQWRLLLWVLRQSTGWNREMTSFSWYRMARDLTLDRGGVARAGQRLLGAGLLRIRGDQVGLEQDSARWDPSRLAPQGEKAMTGVTDDGSQRKPMTAVIATDDASQRKRCQESSLFRRAKDSSKERLKTYRKSAWQRSDDGSHRPGHGHQAEPRSQPAAARPGRGKYDRLSQN